MVVTLGRIFNPPFQILSLTLLWGDSPGTSFQEPFWVALLSPAQVTTSVPPTVSGITE